MHILFRESHGLEETAPPIDLGQNPADLVVLSFSDSDLGAFAAGWHRAEGTLPSLRLANLAALRHPLSIDTYVEATLSGARGILIRLIGGEPYWSHGLAQLRTLAARKSIALAVLSADGRPDPQLDAASTLPRSTLRRLQQLCDQGGAISAQAALQQMALASGLYAAPVRGVRGVAMVGGWTEADSGTCPAAFALTSRRHRILLVFYRAYLAAADLDPIEALARALETRGYDVLGLFVSSLKDGPSRGWLSRWIRTLAPSAVINATAFSAQDETGHAVLETADVPVFQIALATNPREAWEESARGLSPADLAMHVALPEVDGRLFAGVASFKDLAPRDPDLEFSRAAHRADPGRIAAIADRVTGWIRLADLPPRSLRPALVLSTYPGRGWNMAHAVGLDPLESARAILSDLRARGYDMAEAPTDPDHQSDPSLAPFPSLSPSLRKGEAGPDPLAAALASDRIAWPLEAYEQALARLPESLRATLAESWGRPEDDPACRDGAFRFAAVRFGKGLVALQPERGRRDRREADYHDVGLCPRHGYVAFYLWLREQTDVVIHVGAHGTLEWLPGKSVALSDTCWPEALIGPLPMIYPFIVNDPGEASQARRRLGAVTLGHLPPPLAEAGPSAGLARLEALLDEFSNADGLDPARRDRLQKDIRDEAEARGLAAELGLERAESVAEAITRIDRFVCDIKESRFGEGLHVFGRGQEGEAERQGLLTALSGRFVPPGPAGSPYRGRQDVLPTGRNLFSIDPRAVPSQTAHAQGVRLAEELLRRHLQDHGEWPRSLLVNLWGSATMRTAGEEFAMALHLLGVKPRWDSGTERVTGIEILPLAMLDRPRLDVTLRVSGLFRDVFPDLVALFGQAVRALAARAESPDWNPFAARPQQARVYGPAPGHYGLGLGETIDTYSEATRLAAGEAWLAASSHALDREAFDPAGLRERVAATEAFVHLQDLPETDLLLAEDYAAHEAGFAAAQSLAGGDATLYHLDASHPEAPRARRLGEEIARVVRARAANPAWVAGMMRHGFRGGAEIAATLEHLGAFAHLSGTVPPQLFDLYHEATLGNPEVRAFLARENPEALNAMEGRFSALLKAGLWATRRNSILAELGG